MALSEIELLCAAQSGGINAAQARNELPIRFAALLRYLANHARRTYHLDASHTDDIIQRILVAVFDPDRARFDPARAKEGPEAYLRLFAQNAARDHAAFVRHGDKVRHNYADPDNTRRHLPASPDDVADQHDPWVGSEARETAVAVLAMADPQERALVVAVYYQGLTPGKAAGEAGVDRTTVTRRLARLFLRFRERGTN
jgi:RNA polymerase sigma factor (sigma-70 family)